MAAAVLYKIRFSLHKNCSRDFFCKGSSPGILPGGAEIFLGGHTVFLFKGAEKVVVAPETAGLVHLGDGEALLNEGAAAVQPGLYDVAVYGLAGLAFEFPGNMLPGDENSFSRRSSVSSSVRCA